MSAVLIRFEIVRFSASQASFTASYSSASNLICSFLSICLPPVDIVSPVCYIVNKKFS